MVEVALPVPRRLGVGRWFRPEILVMVIGVKVLCGWAFGVPRLRSVLERWPTMKPNAAVAVILAGGGLWMARAEPVSSRRRLAVRCCAGGMLLIGSLTFIEYL